MKNQLQAEIENIEKLLELDKKRTQGKLSAECGRVISEEFIIQTNNTHGSKSYTNIFACGPHGYCYYKETAPEVVANMEFIVATANNLRPILENHLKALKVIEDIKNETGGYAEEFQKFELDGISPPSYAFENVCHRIRELARQFLQGLEEK